MTRSRIVMTTVGLLEAAEKLADELVKRRLAACVNIVGPIRSVYHWKQELQHEQEYLLLIKTTEECAAQLQPLFKELHPYDLPEHLEIAITGGSEQYLQWLMGEVGGR